MPDKGVFTGVGGLGHQAELGQVSGGGAPRQQPIAILQPHRLRPWRGFWGASARRRPRLRRPLRLRPGPTGGDAVLHLRRHAAGGRQHTSPCLAQPNKRKPARLLPLPVKAQQVN